VKTRVRMTLVALVALPLVAAAADEEKMSCLNNFTFSQDFLHRHPKAGAACREVTMKNGEKWARFDARVAALKGQDVTVDFLDTFDKPIETMTFTAPKDARVVVNGQEMTYSALGKGDKLSFWVPESRAGFYAEPGAAQLKELRVARATDAP
jgi:hypothetical protein